MTTVLSPSADYRATVSDTPIGVSVAVRTCAHYEGRRFVAGTQVHRVIIDAPFHIVLDRVVGMLAELERGQ